MVIFVVMCFLVFCSYCNYMIVRGSFHEWVLIRIGIVGMRPSELELKKVESFLTGFS